MSSRSFAWFHILIVLTVLASLIPAPRPAQADAPRVGPNLPDDVPPAAHVPAPAVDDALSVPDVAHPATDTGTPAQDISPEAKDPLQLSLVVDPQEADPGAVLTYTLTLTNSGKSPLTDLVANVVFVPDLTFLRTAETKPKSAYNAESFTLRYDPLELKPGSAIHLTFFAQLGKEADGSVPCSAFVGKGNPIDLPSATAVVVAGGGRDSSGPDLDAGWQLLYNAPTVSTFSGAATYNLSLELPPGRNGLQPSVNLGYSSRAVDATTWWVDSEWVGMGWSIDSVDITRTNARYCWDDNDDWICISDDFTLVLNGASYALTAGANGRYYAENAPGLLVQRHDDSSANYTGEYWTVHTPDGTKYRLGHETDSEQKLYRVYFSPYDDLSKHQVYRWRLDEVRDTMDNVIHYDYVEYPQYDRDYASYVHNIWYNYGTSDWASQVEFVGQTVGTEPGKTPIFRTRRKLNSIKVHHLGQIVREYVFDYDTETHANASVERTLTDIDTYGLGGKDEGQMLPGTSFTYQDLYNKDWELGGHQDECNLDGTPKPGGDATMCAYWGEQFPYPRLARVDNGYGGVTALTYSTALQNGSLPEKNYTVSETQTWDGVHYDYPTATAPRTTYDFTTACWDSEGQGCDSPISGSNKLMGFGEAEVQHQEHNGSSFQTLTRTEHEFDISTYWKMGREKQQDVYAGEGTTSLLRTESTYYDDGTGLPSGIHFVYLQEREITVWQDGWPRTQRSTYAYNVSHQGGAQYGNLTQTSEYDDADALYRIRGQTFVPDVSAWIVNKPDRSYVVDPDWNLLGTTFYLYDGQETIAQGPDEEGLLTLQRTFRNPMVQPLSNGDVVDTVDVRYQYDDDGNLTDQVSYAGYGRVKYGPVSPPDWDNRWIGSGATYTTTTDYDTTYNLYPLQVTNPLTHTSHTEYYGVNGVSTTGGVPGLVRRVWDANGQDTATRFFYDEWGRTTKVVRPDDSETTPTVAHSYWDAPGMAATFLEPMLVTSSYADGSEVRRFSDGLGRVVQTQQAGAEIEGQTGLRDVLVSSGYDALGRQAWQTVPYDVAAYVWNGQTPYVAYVQGTQPETEMSYDALGRVTQVEHPDGTTVDSSYNGYRATVEDENGHEKVQVVDAFGRLNKVQEKKEGVTFNTTYAYDESDNLMKVTDQRGNVITMTYDALGRKLTMNDPDMGDWVYEYNPAGSLASQTDARDCTISFDYDALERLTDKSYETGCAATVDVSYQYDQGTNATGYRTGMTDGSGSSAWTYDTRGRVTQETQVISGSGGGTFVTKWDYDSLDRVDWTRYPGGTGGQLGETVQMDRVPQGLLDSVWGTDTYVQDTTYDAAGRVELRTLGSDVLETDYVYYDWTALNGRGRLHKIRSGASDPPTDLQNLRYTYDAVGNVTQIEDFNAGTGAQIQSFSYDDLDRLESASVTSGGNGVYSESYKYNSIGNMTEKGGVTYKYPDSGENSVRPHAVIKLDGDLKYVYDDNGNMTTRESGNVSYTLEYDAENRLTGVSVDEDELASYTYDGDGARVKQETRLGTTAYVGNIYELFVPEEGPIGEVGTLGDTLRHSPQTVVLSRQYANPVVFAQPISRDAAQTAVVRIKDVRPDRFTLWVDEAPDQDGTHSTEAVSYVVLEAGRWKLPNGKLLEVGVVDSEATVGRLLTNEWEPVSFGLPFSSTPVVISQVQTNHDAHWVKTRQKSVASTGFDVGLEQDEATTTAHSSETIGWMAIEAGTGSWNGHAYEAAKTANAVTDAWYQINFSQTFSAAPRFVAGLGTYDGADNAHLRYRRNYLTSTGAQVLVEEDTTYDSELTHTSEVVDYVAIEGDGTLTGEVYQTSGQVTTKYYYAEGQRVAMRQSGELHWLLTDHLGSTAITAEGSTGDKEAELRYKAYGENRSSWGETLTDYRYTGQAQHSMVDLYYYNARWYDPYLNRWTQPDTIIPDFANPQSLNRFSYVNNNPVRFVDPSGHQSELPPLDPIIQTAVEYFESFGWSVVGDPGLINRYWNGADLVFTGAENRVLAVELKEIAGNVNLGTLGKSRLFQDYGGSLQRVYRSSDRFIDSTNEQLRLMCRTVVDAGDAGKLENALFHARSIASDKVQTTSSAVESLFNGVYRLDQDGKVQATKPLQKLKDPSFWAQVGAGARSFWNLGKGLAKNLANSATMPPSIFAPGPESPFWQPYYLYEESIDL